MSERTPISAWTDLLRACEQVAPGRDAIRLANVAIAAAAARRRRLLPGAFADALAQLAVEPLPADPADLEPLAGAAEQVTFVDMDAWVQAFQGSDPARKSRGAYATPQTLARPLARQLLRAGVPARVVDPSAGAGGLLIAVLQELKRTASSEAEVAGHVARLHGVELDPVARELSCLLIWLTAAVPALSPRDIGRRLVTANAITYDWQAAGPFDALIMNPPWDSLRHSDARADLERAATLQRLLEKRPAAGGLPPLYSLQGRGDRNLYKAFMELAPHLLAERGRLVALVPGAWSSDLGTAPLRRLYLDQMALEQWTSFENLRGYFPIDGRYKFGVLAAERARGGTAGFKTRGFAADADDLLGRHVRVDAGVDLLGGAVAILPDLVSDRERTLLRRYLAGGVPLFAADGPLGSVRYERELDMTEDRKRGAFVHVAESGAVARGDGTWAGGADAELVPLVEGRMVSAYDFHAKTWESGAGRTARWTWANGHRLGDCRPQFLAPPRAPNAARVAICDVTSATNTRTVLATWVPPTWSCGNTAPVLVFASQRLALAGLAVLNSMVFDWLARRVIAGLHLNRFYLEALVWPELDDERIDALAAAAAALTALSPRYADLGAPKLDVPTPALDLVEAHARIECLVAEGYGLAAVELATVYDPSLDDRRGFWRHFAADPHSAAIADRVIEHARVAPGRVARRPDRPAAAAKRQLSMPL